MVIHGSIDMIQCICGQWTGRGLSCSSCGLSNTAMRIPNRGLIVRQPWADMIVNGDKPWEMRAIRTKIRGQIAIITGGHIIGEVELTDCLSPLRTKTEAISTLPFHKVKDHELLGKWKWPWVMERTVRYGDPIPVNVPRGAVIWVKDLRSRV